MTLLITKPSTSTPSPQPEFPYKWDDISSKLLLTSSKEIPGFIHSPAFLAAFLAAWTDYRDPLPLKPLTPTSAAPSDSGTNSSDNGATPLQPAIIPPKDKDAMTDLVTTISTMMESMSSSPYDRPTPTSRKTWPPSSFLQCLLYQCTRDLACPSHTFATSFKRRALKNEAGHKEAMHRLRGLVMLVCNLVVNYTLMPPSNIIHRIENAKPASNPEFSAIPEARIKWALDHMGVEELRKKVLDDQRGGGRRRGG